MNDENKTGSDIDQVAVAMQIISFAGVAKSCAFEAIGRAKNHEFKEAEDLIKEAEKNIVDAERQHFDIVKKEASGDKVVPTVLFMHSEDQMLTSQMMIGVAKEFIEVYKRFEK